MRLVHILVASLSVVTSGAATTTHLRRLDAASTPPAPAQNQIVMLAGLRETECPSAAPWCDYGCRCQTVHMMTVAATGNRSRIDWRTDCPKTHQHRQVVVDLQQESDDRWRCHSLTNTSSCGVYNATLPDLCMHVLGHDNMTTAMQRNGLRTFVRIRDDENETSHNLPEVWVTTNDRQMLIAFQDLLLYCLHRTVPNVRLFSLYDVSRCAQ